MMLTNLKRMLLTALIATAWGIPASAQIEYSPSSGRVQEIVDGEVQVTPPTAATTFSLAVPPTGSSTAFGWTATASSSPYWIGVECQPIDPAVRKALKLTDETGIIIARVSEDSPASKAGLQVGDILQRWLVGEQEAQPIKDVETLVKLVQDHAAKQTDQAAKIELTRGGEKMELAVKPERREIADKSLPRGKTLTQAQQAADSAQKLQQQMILDSARTGLENRLAEARARLEEAKARYEAIKDRAEAVRQGVESATESKAALAQAEAELKIAKSQVQLAETQLQHSLAHVTQYQDWAKAMQAHGFQLPAQGAANFDMLIPAPAIVTGRVTAAGKALELPDDMRVTIVREGKKPAQITVEQGDKKIEVTADKVKELPQDIRPLVEQMLAPAPSRMLRLFQAQGNDMPGRVEVRVPEGERVPVPGMPIAPPRVVIHATPQVQPLPTLAPQATQKQIEDLQKAVEQLRKQIELMERK